MSQDDNDLDRRGKEIEELVDEENRDDDDLERNSQTPLEEDPLQKEQIFPSVGRIDSHQNKLLAEELEQEEAIFNEVLKKRYQGFNAQKLSMMADRARINKKHELLDGGG